MTFLRLLLTLSALVLTGCASTSTLTSRVETFHTQIEQLCTQYLAVQEHAQALAAANPDVQAAMGIAARICQIVVQ